MNRAVLVLLAASPVAALNNGLGLTPPMGWRSWNCYGGNVNQTKMTVTMDRMTARTRKVNGKLKSLLDLGYNHVGLDDNWQKCGQLNGQRSFHDADGNPIIDTTKFPNMSAMTAHGHNVGLRVGWYMNNCICAERGFSDPVLITKIMERSAAAVGEFNFDGLKLDSCSQFNNLTWWASLLNATGRHILIENCHQGGNPVTNAETQGASSPPYVNRDHPGPGNTQGNCKGTTAVSDCPYNLYRTSGDINPNFGHMMGNVNTVVKFLGTKTLPPSSRPGAWAYPDMLEVGNLEDYAADEAHFGLWVVTSSPLILGFDMLDDEKMARVWPIITNTEAIAINQAWFGSPGQLLMSRDESQHPDAQGFLNYSGALQAGDDLKVEDEITVAAAEAWCATDAACEGFTYNSSNVNEAKKKVYFKTGITLNYDKAWSTYIKGAHAPPGSNTQQVWVKRLGPEDAASGGAPMAVLCVNAGPVNGTADFTVSLTETSGRGRMLLPSVKAVVLSSPLYQDTAPDSSG
eukprot:gene7317-8221_t